ncbi:MAG: hypothetical protein ACRDN0_32620 [Trebonia sp.]
MRGRLMTAGATAAVALFAVACGTQASGNPAADTATVGAASASAGSSGTGSSGTVSSTPGASAVSATPTPSVSPAGVVSPAASANAAASPASSPAAAASAESCATYAVTHTFAQVTGAKENSDGSLVITAHSAKVVCGGTDDLHYDVATAAETGTVTSSGTVQVLGSNIQEQTIPHSEFSARLASDQWGRIFMVTGPLSGITKLAEMYHP